MRGRLGREPNRRFNRCWRSTTRKAGTYGTTGRDASPGQGTTFTASKTWNSESPMPLPSSGVQTRRTYLPRRPAFQHERIAIGQPSAGRQRGVTRIVVVLPGLEVAGRLPEIVVPDRARRLPSAAVVGNGHVDASGDGSSDRWAGASRHAGRPPFHRAQVDDERHRFARIPKRRGRLQEPWSSCNGRRDDDSVGQLAAVGVRVAGGPARRAAGSIALAPGQLLAPAVGDLRRGVAGPTSLPSQ